MLHLHMCDELFFFIKGFRTLFTLVWIFFMDIDQMRIESELGTEFCFTDFANIFFLIAIIIFHN